MATIKARSTLLKNAYPNIPTIIAYYDAGSVGSWKGVVDAFALDIYPGKFSWNMALITQLAAAADSAGLSYYGVISVGDNVVPMPTVSQLQQMDSLWAATNQKGYMIYAWGGSDGAPTQNQLQNQPALLAVLQAYNST